MLTMAGQRNVPEIANRDHQFHLCIMSFVLLSMLQAG